MQLQFLAYFLIAGLKYQADFKHQIVPSANLLCRALAGVHPSVTSIAEFQSVSAITSRTVAREILEFLAGQGIGNHSARQIRFSHSDRMTLAMECIRKGCDVGEVSELLTWKDFEQLASEILGAFGYQTTTNVRFTKPRMEIDVVGTMSSLAIAVDCKHWKSYSRSMISEFAKKQAARASRLFEKPSEKISKAVPIILTLHEGSDDYVDTVPVVPVTRFRSFISEIESYLPEVLVIKKS